MDGYVSSMRPQEVAREVEALRRRGCLSFTLRSVDHGGMLDRERLGAARYAAGLQAGVALEAEKPTASAAPARRR
jgi:hypothetical protein